MSFGGAKRAGNPGKETVRSDRTVQAGQRRGRLHVAWATPARRVRDNCIHLRGQVMHARLCAQARVDNKVYTRRKRYGRWRRKPVRDRASSHLGEVAYADGADELLVVEVLERPPHFEPLLKAFGHESGIGSAPGAGLKVGLGSGLGLRYVDCAKRERGRGRDGGGKRKGRRGRGGGGGREGER
eukprot:4127798-Pleurochrysis_carterae.AAC.1